MLNYRVFFSFFHPFASIGRALIKNPCGLLQIGVIVIIFFLSLDFSGDICYFCGEV